MNNHKSKTLLTEQTLTSVARRVIRAARAHFGRNLLAYSDDKWEQEINPWMDHWIDERYMFTIKVPKEDLDDMISIELDSQENSNDNGSH